MLCVLERQVAGGIEQITIEAAFVDVVRRVDDEISAADHFRDQGDRYVVSQHLCESETADGPAGAGAIDSLPHEIRQTDTREEATDGRDPEVGAIGHLALGFDQEDVPKDSNSHGVAPPLRELMIPSMIAAMSTSSMVKSPTG